MNPLKKLAGQTAIYGLSSIVGRLLNYLLVPIYTRVFMQAEFGVITELYAYSAFLLVIFVYGMETSFFRFNEKEEKEKNRVFSTSLLSILATTLFFTITIIVFSPSIAGFLRYPQHYEFIIFFAIIIGFDAVNAIPFARLRAQNRALRFATLKLIGIGANIGFVLLFLFGIPWILNSAFLSFLHPFIEAYYNPDYGVGYVFIANLMASGITTLLLLPEFRVIRYGFDRVIWKQMLKYGLPLLLVGLAGVANEMLDRILLKFLLPYDDDEYIQGQIGIYGACYKLAMLMTMFIQAYRYAAEPFFFAQARKENARIVYANLMNYFVIAGTLIFLGVMLYIDIFKFFIGPRFHDGLHIVPIILMANLFLGVYYSLSIWYKLTDRTKTGAAIAIGGAIVTLVANILLVPHIGFEGAAWATFFCYFSMSAASYLLGRRYYPIPYNLPKAFGYILLALVVYTMSLFLVTPNFPEQSLSRNLLNSGLFFAYLGFVIFREWPYIKTRSRESK